jgi:phosphopantothenoylcysteine decarboxylase/phosphopantothenate--cysteine ligase
MSALSGKKVLLGITGSIAAYKSLEVLRELRSLGVEVKVVLTRSAPQFVPALTLRIFSGHPVRSDAFEPEDEVLHLTLAESADLILIAPATANLLAKLAVGLADDLLSTLLLGVSAPLLLAPAMDGGMWEHPAVQRNVSMLRKRGAHFIGPTSGPLASGKSGLGRMAEPSEIVRAAVSLLRGSPRDLENHLILVTAGPTQEPIDPVRYLTNRSSGKMGYAIAARARDRGANVILVSGPSELSPPEEVEFHPVRTAEEMEQTVLKRVSALSVLIMAAAVGDYRVKMPASQKIKKEERKNLTLELVRTTDILKKVREQREDLFIVGFAAETGRLAENAKQKLADKKLDLIVANEVGQEGIGFGSDQNEVTLLGKGGWVSQVPRSSKTEVADRILDAVRLLMKTDQTS